MQPMNTRLTPIALRELTDLSHELQDLSDYKLTSNGGGQYTGSILGFVKGLRLSAKLIYFLRTALSSSPFEVSWGHIMDPTNGSISPECDVIIHNRGHLGRWNGGEHPVMDFRFVETSNVRAVVSCKSRLATIDDEYPRLLAKHSISNVILFAECCARSNYENLKGKALAAGYSGLWCAYFLGESEDEMIEDENHRLDFWHAVRALFSTASTEKDTSHA